MIGAREGITHDILVVLRRGSRHGLLLVWLLTGCVSTQLQSGPDDPANPAAESAAQPRMGSALGGEPASPELSERASEGARQHTGHQHPSGATQSTPSGASPVSPAPAHQHGHHGETGTTPVPARRDEGATDAAPVWTCPMHPEIRKPEPGNCPICGMKLQPAPPKAPGGATP